MRDRRTSRRVQRSAVEAKKECPDRTDILCLPSLTIAYIHHQADYGAPGIEFHQLLIEIGKGSLDDSCQGLVRSFAIIGLDGDRI
jgi:hypothetical protein